MIQEAKSKGFLINQYGHDQYHHKVSAQGINCPHMIKSNTSDPLKCPIYFAMKQQYQFNQENIDHLYDFNHFQNEYEQKPECKYNDECKAYIRAEQGTDQNRIDDKSHMAIYRHPPRARQIKLAENIHSLILNKNEQANHPLYKPTFKDAEGIN